MGSEKQTIIEALDRRELLLPARVHEAIEANARVKYYLSLLQMASAHADAPETPAIDLAEERKRCGIDDASLDAVVSGARRGPDDDYRIPRLRELGERMDHELARMIAPVALAEGNDAAEAWRRRLESLRERRDELLADGSLSVSVLSWMTSADPGGDGPHRFCMELHKAIAGLESVGTELVDGARTFGLTEEDRPFVAAFMRGLQRTAKLKFEHPGLGTMATRAGARLIIENDIGTTDAHVLVVELEGAKVVVTSADVHVQRLAFFQRMLSAGFPLAWEDTRSRRAPGLEEDAFFLCAGTLVAKDSDEVARFLEHLGSRLVFLIDWNKARKTLQYFVPKAPSLSLLQAAADADLGHRAFLELGGEQLVYDAMAAVMRTPLRFGERLDDAIGVEATTNFLRFVLRETAEGLLERRSHSLIRERVRAELASQYVAAGERMLEPARRHALIVQQLAATIANALTALGDAKAATARREEASRAKNREREADEIVVEVRSLVERIPEAAAFGRIAEAADDAADELEEAVFTITLMPEGLTVVDGVRGALRRLGELVEQGASAWVACLEAARHARRGAAGADMRAFLDAVDRVVTIEREADEAERRATTELMLREAVDARMLLVTARIARHLESATDALLHAALTLRNHVQGAVMIERP